MTEPISEQRRIGTLNQYERALLLKYIEYTKLFDVSAVDENQLWTLAKNAGVHKAITKPLIDKLLTNGFLEKKYDDGSMEEWYNISPLFYDEAIPYYRDEPNDATIKVPTSDRFVSVSENRLELIDALSALKNLSEAVRSANELTADSDDRIQLSKEVDAIKDLVSQPRIHVVALYDAVNSNSTLKWLAEQTISGVVRTAAGKVFEYLITLLHTLLK